MGAACARALADRGYRIVADVSDPDQARHMVGSALERFGRLDAAVNAAGVAQTDVARTADRGRRVRRCQAVGPGSTGTPMTQGWDTSRRASQLARHPLGRFAAPEEIAALVAYLVSPGAGQLSDWGQLLSAGPFPGLDPPPQVGQHPFPWPLWGTSGCHNVKLVQAITAMTCRYSAYFDYCNYHIPCLHDRVGPGDRVPGASRGLAPAEGGVDAEV
jgi:Enoyl-(Acyl carrier protein) reductase